MTLAVEMMLVIILAMTWADAKESFLERRKIGS